MSQQIIRGRLLSFHDQPRNEADPAYTYVTDGALVVEEGRIIWAGAADALPDVYIGAPETDHRPHLIVPGFVDAHTHFPQIQVIASYGAQLLDWLNTYTFKQEARFADPDHCAVSAKRFLDELTANGVTTAAVYGSSHRSSVDAFFTEAKARNIRMIGGKVMMDRGAPANVRDTPQSAYDDSLQLIADWHGQARLSYAITPRFAITSTPEQLDVAGALLKENPTCYMQTHLSETPDEVSETLRLYPDAADYLDVYDRHGLLGERSLFGHCIHLSQRERARMAETRSVAVFCPTSNLFLGSGLFDYQGIDRAGIRIAAATDVGGGTSYSMLTTMAEGYKVAQLRGQTLHPFETFYRVTLGSARALSLDDKIGQLAAGFEADFVVLDARATPAMAGRMDVAETLAEELFVLQMLGDERAIKATYIAGDNQKP